jgi:hypothetical protein
MTTAQVGYPPVYRWVKQVLGNTHTTVVATVAWAVLCLLVAQRVTSAALARALPAEQAGSGRSCLRAGAPMVAGASARAGHEQANVVIGPEHHQWLLQGSLVLGRISVGISMRFSRAETVGTVPPSMTYSVPVIDAACAEARNATRSATSLGLAGRASGMPPSESITILRATAASAADRACHQQCEALSPREGSHSAVEGGRPRSRDGTLLCAA